MILLSFFCMAKGVCVFVDMKRYCIGPIWLGWRCILLLPIYINAILEYYFDSSKYDKINRAFISGLEIFKRVNRTSKVAEA